MITKIIQERALKNPTKVAFLEGSESMTYEAFYSHAKNLAGSLQKKGVRGKCIAVHLTNSIDLAITYTAIFMSGGIAVPIDMNLKSGEREYILEQSQAFFTIDVSYPIRTKETWEEKNVIDEMAPAAIFYTSGSTSRPKGVVHSHRSLLAMLNTFIDAGDLTSEDRFLVCESMSNASGCCHAFSSSLVGGSALIISEFNIPEFIKALDKSPTILCIMGRGNYDIVHEEFLTKEHFKSVKMNLSGGDKITQTLIDEFKEKTGVPIRYGYGMSEFLMFTINKSEEREKGTSVGTVLKNVTLELRDGNNCVVDDEGELWAKGENMMLGYWDDEIQTKKTVIDGWLRTGDLLRRDKEGYYWFRGRIKQMIVREGDNVSPLEIEEVFSKHPAIKIVAVVGVPDAIEGAVPKAFVQLKEGVEATEQELIEFARKYLAEYKVPVAVQFLGCFPRTASGKIARKELF